MSGEWPWGVAWARVRVAWGLVRPGEVDAARLQGTTLNELALPASVVPIGRQWLSGTWWALGGPLPSSDGPGQPFAGILPTEQWGPTHVGLSDVISPGVLASDKGSGQGPQARGLPSCSPLRAASQAGLLGPGPAVCAPKATGRGCRRHGPRGSVPIGTARVPHWPPVHFLMGDKSGGRFLRS